MAVEFSKIRVGSTWDRNALAAIWKYKSFHAIARGVCTPADDKKVILFVTEEKQESSTQYADRLMGGKLEWEGEAGHFNDRRIAEAADAGDEIHIFYRERHHKPFTYLGLATVISAKLSAEKPSKFVFRVNR